VHRYGQQDSIRYALAVQIVLTALRPFPVSGSMILGEMRGGAWARGHRGRARISDGGSR